MKDADLKELGISWFRMIKDHLKLMRLESELAQISLVPLLISGVALTLFLLTIWCLILAGVLLGLIQWGLTPLMSIGCLLFIMIIGLMSSYLLVCRYKNRMKFERTRARIKEIVEE